jgi:NitT/TauT family transport system substrate-binding protein
MNVFRRSFWLCLAVALPCVICYSVVSSEAQEKKLIRMISPSFSWNSDLVFRVATLRGYFKTEGLTVESILIRGGAVATAALVSGEVDFGSGIGLQAPVRAKAKGLDLVIVGCITTKAMYGLVGNKDTRTVEDLRGKAIGVTGPGGFSDFALRTFLKRNNIDPDKDVTFRSVGGSQFRIVAFEQGTIAAAPFGVEETVALVKKGYPLISNLSETVPIPSGGLISRGELLRKYPETVRRYFRALVLALQHTRKNKADAIKAGFESGLTGEPDVVSKAYDFFIPAYSADLSVPMAGVQAVIAEEIRSGTIDSKFKAESVVDERILKKVQEELRREGRLTP